MFDVLDIGGEAWLFNELSHIEEHAHRTDVYVIHPSEAKILDQFNLTHPFPTWAAPDEDSMLYIRHWAKFDSQRNAGYLSGVTKLNPITREQSFVEIPHSFSFKDLDVYQGTVCMPNRTLNGSEHDGLWCLDGEDKLVLRIPQNQATGVMFVSSSGDR